MPHPHTIKSNHRREKESKREHPANDRYREVLKEINLTPVSCRRRSISSGHDVERE